MGLEGVRCNAYDAAPIDMTGAGILCKSLMVNSLGVYRSGQPGQTVNLLAFAYAGSNPAAPTTFSFSH